MNNNQNRLNHVIRHVKHVTPLFLKININLYLFLKTMGATCHISIYFTTGAGCIKLLITF
jgi:hypothetical protein